MSADITHPVVAPCQPPDSSMKVWRYMDVTRLVALMETRSLHFARADTLDDPFEGSLALRNQMAHEQMITRMLEDQENNPPSAVRYTRSQLRDMLAQGTLQGRQWVFISCWHGSETESLAMWRQYGSSGGSVVIQSTYQKLLDALPSETCYRQDQDREYEHLLGNGSVQELFQPSGGLNAKWQYAVSVHSQAYRIRVRKRSACFPDVSRSGHSLDFECRREG